jgi:hypothetical protein
MDIREALTILISRYRVAAQVVEYEYDPAGSSYSLAPSPRDLEVLRCFGVEIKEDDLYLTTYQSKEHFSLDPKSVRLIVDTIMEKMEHSGLKNVS